MNYELTLFPEFDMQQPNQKTWHIGLTEELQSTLRQRARNVKKISALAILMRGREFEVAQQELRYVDNGFVKWCEEEACTDNERAYEEIKIWKAYGQLLSLFLQNSAKTPDTEMFAESANIPGRTVLLESSKDDVPQSAREEIINRHASGEKVTIEEAKDIIEYQKQVKEASEKAEEDAKKRADAERKLEEAEKQAKKAEDKLKEQEEEEGILQELIRGLREEKEKIEASKVQTIKEDTDETIQKLKDMDRKINLLEGKQKKSEEDKKKLEDDLKLTTDQKKNLSDAKKDLEKQIKEYRDNDRKHKHIERTRTRFGQARDAIRHGLQQASARWISPIDAEQAFEPDDWAALDQTLADLKRWEEECLQLKKSAASRFIDSSPVVEAPLVYIEAGR
jgi:DNA repair exonuclease SbcCD ATPase subunit